MTHRFLPALLLAAALAAAGCSLFGGGGTKIQIPDTYTTGNATYTLLYSTLGYDAAATKRLLIRQNDTAAPAQTGLAFRWRLVAESGQQAAAGTASFAGTGWGIPVWAADFSSVTKPGAYRLTVEAPDVQLATRPFRIDDFLLSRETYIPIALDNAAARAAPVELDNGFFDSNTREGTAWAHGHFLDGLLVFYEARRTSMTEDMRQRTRDAIARAVDYLLLLSDPATGEVRHASPRRPYQGADPTDTAETVRALARYAAVFQKEDSARAERAYRLAKLGEEWLFANAPASYGLDQQAAVAFDLYRYAGDLAQLDRAVRAVRDFAPSYDLRTMERQGGDPSPQFETMYLLWRELPDHPDRPLWVDTANRVAAQYRDMLDRNAFGVIAPAVTDPATGQTPADQWDNAATEAVLGEGAAGAVGNAWFMARAADASYLAAMTDDKQLEEAATASILWIAGLNPGLPAARVAGAGGSSPLEAATFITGAGPSRSAMPWSAWEWPRAAGTGTIAGGFLRGFAYDDSEAAAGTSIARDGAWLEAVVAYEGYLHPGRRAAEPEPPEPPAERMRVANATPSEADGLPALLVNVVDASGAPLVGAKVSAAWVGVAVAGEGAESAVRVTQCETAAGGACALSLDFADQPRRPITVTITNLEYAGYPYVPPSDPITATFP